MSRALHIGDCQVTTDLRHDDQLPNGTSPLLARFAWVVSGLVLAAGVFSLLARIWPRLVVWGVVEFCLVAAAAAFLAYILAAIERVLSIWKYQVVVQRQAGIRIAEGLLAEIKRLREDLSTVKIVDRKQSLPSPLESLSEKDLRDRLEAAQELDEIDEVLEAHAVLVKKVPETDRGRLDEEVSIWCADYLQRALRAGRAVQIVRSMERAVAALGDQEAMEPLREALPTIKMSAKIATEARDGPKDEETNGSGHPDPFL